MDHVHISYDALPNICEELLGINEGVTEVECDKHHNKNI